jgi:hypothetical protein
VSWITVDPTSVDDGPSDTTGGKPVLGALHARETASVASTEIELVFRVRGAGLRPAALTEQTGVVPSRAFEVGEAAGASALVAGWEWGLGTADTDEPLLTSLLAASGPHRAVLRQWHDAGCAITLTVVGTVAGDLVTSAVEADRRGHVWSDEPYLDVDRVGVSLTAEAVVFLADIGASYSTHIDCEYDHAGHDGR